MKEKFVAARERRGWQTRLRRLGVQVDRKKETEAKCEISPELQETTEDKLVRMGAKKIFEGTTETYWFQNPRAGVGVRIKKVIPDDPNIFGEYVWTIKFSSAVKVMANLLKHKLEYEGTARSFEEAQEQLRVALSALGMTTDLSAPKLVVGKRRTSFEVPSSEKDEKDASLRKLRADSDTLLDVNGHRIDSPIHLVELEDTSAIAVNIKQQRIERLAALLGLPLDPAHAGLSTKDLLKEKGLISDMVVQQVSPL